MIRTDELIEDLKSNEDFFNSCEHDDNIINVLYLYMDDATSCLESDMPSGKLFTFIEAYKEKHDNYINYHAIYSKDGIFYQFSFCSNDYGNSSYEEFLQEVIPKPTVKIKWICVG